MGETSHPHWARQASAARFLSEVPGRATRHAFSFGPHYDPANVGFGPLLVCNDDRLGAGCGYDRHPHRGTEILTWVVSGALRHTDSEGRSEILRPGELQLLGAGAGVEHTEGNASPAPRAGHTPQPLRFVQMWLRSDLPAGSPRYARAAPDPTAVQKDWYPVAAGQKAEHAPAALLAIHVASATLWATRLSSGGHRRLPQAASAFLQIVNGRGRLDPWCDVASGDTIRIHAATNLTLRAYRPVEALLWTFGAQEPDPAAMGRQAEPDSAP